MNEGQFNSESLGPDATRIIEQLMSKFVSDGALGRMLTQQLGPMLGLNNLTQSHVNVDGMRTYAGSSSIFGPQQTATFINNAWDNQVIGDIMQPAAQAIEQARIDFRKQTHQQIWGGVNANPAGFSVTNMGADLLFNQSKVDRIADGVAQAARLRGTGSLLDIEDPMARAAMMDQQTGFKRIGALATTDFLRNPQKYGGLHGQEVGELIATMSSSGQIGSDEIKKIGQELEGADTAFVKKLQQTSKAVGELKRVFQGSMSQVLEQANQITGTDLTATFGEDTVAMTRGLAVTGQMAGFSGQQMASLANISSQMSSRMGADSFGALSNAASTARLFATSRGVDMAFVNKNQLRTSLQESVSGAQSSEMARDISGAALLVEDRLGKKAGAAFIEELNAAELTGNPNQIKDILARKGINVELSDIRDASFDKRAEQLRAQGVGTESARLAYSRDIIQSRKAVLERMNIDTSELSERDLSDIDLLKKSAKLDSIQSGAVVRAFNQLGGIGSAWQEDAYLQSSLNTEEMKAFQGRFNKRMKIEGQLGEFNKVDGLTNIRKLLEGPDLGDKSFKEMAAYIAGGTIDIEGLGDAGDVSKSFKALQEYAKGGGVKSRALAEMALKISSTGQFDGKSFDKDQRKEIFDLITSSKSKEDIEKGLSAFVDKSGGADLMYDAEVKAKAYSLVGKDRAISKSDYKRASNLVSLEQIHKLEGKDFDTESFLDSEGKLASGSISDFKKDAAEIRKMMTSGKDESDTFEEALSLRFKGDKDKMKSFIDRGKELGEASSNLEFMKDQGSTGDKMIELLGAILSALANQKPGQSNTQ